MEPKKYILYYGCGLSIEYIIGSVIILYIVRTSQKRLDLQHREEYELKREQRELAEKNHRIQSM